MKYLNYLKLNEDISARSAIVYHSTGRKGREYPETEEDYKNRLINYINSFIQNGFQKSKGKYYGKAIYTTYDLESQIEMGGRYGNILFECKILSLDNFLIFDIEIAKKVYGNKYTIKDQLKKILCNSWNKYKDEEKKSNLSFISLGDYIKDEKEFEELVDAIDYLLNTNISMDKIRKYFIEKYLKLLFREKWNTLNDKTKIEIINSFELGAGICDFDHFYNNTIIKAIKDYNLDSENANNFILNKFHFPLEYNDYENRFNIPRMSTDLFRVFSDKYTKILDKTNGVIFNGSNDGRVLMCYNEKLIEPLRYSLDKGKTWVNIFNKHIYNRIKNNNK